MKTQQVTMEQKLVDWELAFNSMPDKQIDQSLKGLIEGLKIRMGVLAPGIV